MREVSLLLPDGQTAPAQLQAAGGETQIGPGAAGNRIRLSSLPVLLAGPILRRAERNEVVVWVATSVPVTVIGRVLDPHVGSDGRPSGALDELGTSRARPVQLGANLFVTLVAITSSSGFPVRRILAYDLSFVAPPGHRFSGARGLVPKEQLTYGDLTLPTFILDETDRRARDPVRRTVFMHGSCRKLSGPAPDMASKLDDRINRAHGSTHERPRFLLLTGDQIYGDDVPGDLYLPLARASRLLVGFRDLLPNTDITVDSRAHRGELVRTQAGFTSTHADHHLLSFGEYAAMHLFAWSPAIWDCGPIKRIVPRSRRREHYQDAKWMRRAMANVPCYMMIDDHEVTDDWPLDNTIVRNVNASAYGRWIVANGTAAAYFFQLQGNLADTGRSRYASVAHRLRTYSITGMAYESAREAHLASPDDIGLELAMYSAHRPFVDACRQYVTEARLIKGLHAVAPTIPEVMILDTRTQRALTESGPPGLLDATARTWIRNQFANLPGPGYEPLLVLSPPPVVGNPAIDTAQAILGPLGERYEHDCESWNLNHDNLCQFFESLRPLRRKLVFVSGDVHFSYTAWGAYGTLLGRNLITFAQMTGSAMRNQPDDSAGTAAQMTTGSTPLSGSILNQIRYHFVGTPRAIVSNNVSHASVNWRGADDVRLVHTIITANGDHEHQVDF